MFTDGTTVLGILPEALYRGNECVKVLGNTNRVLISDPFLYFHHCYEEQMASGPCSSGDFCSRSNCNWFPLPMRILCLLTTQTPISAWYQDCLLLQNIHMPAYLSLHFAMRWHTDVCSSHNQDVSLSSVQWSCVQSNSWKVTLKFPYYAFVWQIT